LVLTVSEIVLLSYVEIANFSGTQAFFGVKKKEKKKTIINSQNEIKDVLISTSNVIQQVTRIKSFCDGKSKN
jgi:hypothetical protein